MGCAYWRQPSSGAGSGFGGLVLHVVLDGLFPVERGAGVGRALAAGGAVLEGVVGGGGGGYGFGLGKFGFDGGGNAFGTEGAREFALLVLDTFGGEALGGGDEGIALEGDLARGGGAGGLGGEDFILQEVRETAIVEIDVGVEGS